MYNIYLRYEFTIIQFSLIENNKKSLRVNTTADITGCRIN